MSKLVELIIKCLSPDNNTRTKGEQELNNETSQNFYNVLVELSLLITKSDTSSNIRQFCGTYIKYLLNNEQFLQLWNQ